MLCTGANLTDADKVVKGFGGLRKIVYSQWLKYLIACKRDIGLPKRIVYDGD